jgi:hypothetical protein
MSDSILTNTTRRQYRLAQCVVVVGSLAVGSLVVDRLVDALHESFFLYYGISDARFDQLQHVGSSDNPLRIGHLTVAIIALLGTVAFVMLERRRLRRLDAMQAECASDERTMRTELVGARTLFDLFITRTSAFAGVLLALWLLQTSFERFLGGAGWGLEYVDWTSLLPIASVFGVCVLAGMIVAVASLVGLRAIHVLEWALRSIRTMRLRNASRRQPVAWFDIDRIRSFRDLFGCDILSRPPPACA